jgi:hypothetical protein
MWWRELSLDWRERVTLEISWNMECELKRLLNLAVRASPPQTCKQQLYFKIE